LDNFTSRDRCRSRAAGPGFGRRGFTPKGRSLMTSLRWLVLALAPALLATEAQAQPIFGPPGGLPFGGGGISGTENTGKVRFSLSLGTGYYGAGYLNPYCAPSGYSQVIVYTPPQIILPPVVVVPEDRLPRYRFDPLDDVPLEERDPPLPGRNAGVFR